MLSVNKHKLYMSLLVCFGLVGVTLENCVVSCIAERVLLAAVGTPVSVITVLVSSVVLLIEVGLSTCVVVLTLVESNTFFVEDFVRVVSR